MSYSGTVHCSNCYQQGHNRRGCPRMKEFIAANPDSYDARMYKARAEKAKIRRCSYCSEEGHNRRSCKTLKKHTATAFEAQETWFGEVKNWMVEAGMGVGSLVTYQDGYSGDHKTGLIRRMLPSRAVFWATSDNWKGDFIYVVALGDSKGQNGRFLRPPVSCPGYPSDDSWGGPRIESVASPVSGNLVEGQLEKFTPPSTQIYEGFQGHMNEGASAMRGVAVGILGKGDVA